MLPPALTQSLNTLRRAGFQAHPVGGCVRDLLLGHTPQDWDVATSARPEAVMALFPHTVPTGLAHGTVTLVLEDLTLEVTTFRREGGYADGRHPDRVDFHGDLTADLARRDFTINAMALGADGSVIDPFGGQADLAAHLIRAVGDPARRFSEDALRILRGLRFAAQLGFALHPDTAAAMEVQAPRLAHISAERIVAEVEKTLLSPRPHWVGEFFRLGALEPYGFPIRTADWSALVGHPTEGRWPALCALTGLDITALPVSRRVRTAVLHPHRGLEKTLALTGADLLALGLTGREIGAAQKRLVAHILAHPEENTPEALGRVLGI